MTVNDKNGNEIKIGDIVLARESEVDIIEGNEYKVIGLGVDICIEFLDEAGDDRSRLAEYYEIKKEEKATKYEVGKKYVIDIHWAGLLKGDIITVTNIFDNPTSSEIYFSPVPSGGFSSFCTGSFVDDHMTPYEETKSLVTEKVTRVIEAGVKGKSVFVTFDFDLSEKEISISCREGDYNKEELGELIETLKQIHEVM